MKTGKDNGYSGEEEIDDKDAHFGWTLGQFYVSGFTSTAKDDTEMPVFLKNVNDKVILHFKLQQDINKLNGKIVYLLRKIPIVMTNILKLIK